jgi:hypothetical protein
VTLTRDAAAQVEAPAGLRRRVEGTRRARSGRRLLAAGGLAAAGAVAAIAVVLVLPEGAGGPTAAEAALFGGRPATASPPPATRSTLLRRAVDGVSFPNLAAAFGWRPTGLRIDALDGRRIVTVFYEKAGRRIAYTIVPGGHLPNPVGAQRLRVGALELAAFRAGKRLVVDVIREGHTCLLSGVGVERRTLAALAAWNGGGTVPF